MAGVCVRVLLWLVYAGECYYGWCMRASVIMGGVCVSVLCGCMRVLLWANGIMAGVCGRVLLWLVYAGECHYGSCMRASAIMSGVCGRVRLLVVYAGECYYGWCMRARAIMGGACGRVLLWVVYAGECYYW